MGTVTTESVSMSNTIAMRRDKKADSKKKRKFNLMSLLMDDTDQANTLKKDKDGDTEVKRKRPEDREFEEYLTRQLQAKKDQKSKRKKVSEQTFEQTEKAEQSGTKEKEGSPIVMKEGEEEIESIRKSKESEGQQTSLIKQL